MKRTSILLALLFGAMLWFSPVGAQQKTKVMPMPENSGTELKMDKVPPMLQKQEALSQEAIASFENTKMKMVPKMNRVDGLKVSGEVANLSEAQQEEMVRAYMRQAMAKSAKAGDGTDAKHIFVAGNGYYEGMVKATYVNGSRTGLSFCDFPYTYTHNYKDEDGQLTGETKRCDMYPLWGTWNGFFYEGMWGYKNPQTGYSVTVGYYAYDPLTDEAASLTTAYLKGDRGGMFSDACAYDYSSNKVYTLVNEYDETYTGIESITFYSADRGTAVFAEAFSIDVTTSNMPVSMAIDKTGKFYIFCTDGKVYTVKKEGDTYSLEEVGDTKQPTVTYSQSAAWDYRSDKVYWANINKGYAYMSIWDPAQKDTSVQLGSFLQSTGLASVFYVDENPEATDLALTYDGTKVIARFTAPEYTINGDPLTELSAAEIYKSDGTSLTLAKKIENPVPGQKYTEEIAVTETEGTLTYAFRTLNKAGKASARTMANVRLLNIQLPYTNGFEDDESDKMENITLVDPDELGGCGRDADAARTGSYGYKLTSNYYKAEDRLLKIEALSVRQGAGYMISFYYKATSTNCVDVLDGNGKFIGYNDVDESDGWVKFEKLYAVDATGQMAIWIGAEDATNPMYIDDIEIKEVLSPDVPGYAVFNNVTAATDGSLKAIVNMTLPTQTMGDATLSSIDSIEFYWGVVSGDYVTFSPTPANVVKTGLTPGATLDLEAEVPQAGKYCFQAKLYNQHGASVNYSKYMDADGYLIISPWIGPDNLSAITITSEVKTDGSTVLNWTRTEGVNGGYVGTVTYEIKEGETSLYSGTDTTYTLTGLSQGLHMLNLVMTNDKEKTRTQKAYTLSGLDENGTYWNVAPGGTTMLANRSFYTSATAANSGFSQVIYPASGKAMYLDTLLLFTTAPATGEAKQYTKIYMGVTKQEGFAGDRYTGIEQDFIEKENLTEVFADTLRFKAGENTLKLPLKGFYYNGEDNLVITFVKPLQEKTTFAAVPYYGVATETGSIKYLSSARTNISMDTVNFNDYTGYVDNTPIPMVARANTNLKTAKITVKWQNPEDNTISVPVEGVSVRIYKSAGEGKNLDITVLTDENGVATFEYMPEGEFQVVARKIAYIASQPQTLSITQTTVSPATMEIFIERASIRKAEGTVKDKGGKNLADVVVKADDGIFSAQGTTNENGVFELSIYGSSEYELVFEKAGMKTYKMMLGMEEKDTVLANVAMDYIPVPVASVNAVNGEVSWTKPAASDEISWTKGDTAVRRLTADGKMAFKYAQRFLPADLATYGMEAPKALQMGFVPGSETAEYTLVLAYDTTHEIFRKKVNSADLVNGEWHFENVDADVAQLDFTRQLWLIVEVAASENQGYACAATATTAAAGKSNLIFFQGVWYKISDVFTSGNASVLISLKAQDVNTALDAANGYRVYRGLAEDKFEDFELLTQNPVKALTYTDQDWANLGFGRYVYAVTSDWYDNNVSEPVTSNVLLKDMKMNVKFVVTSNAGSAKDAYVYMVDTARTHSYDAEVNDKDTAAIAGKVWRGVYDYEITLPYHQTVVGRLDLTRDTVIKVELKETVVDAELTATVEGFDVVMNYGVNLHNWFDDVESYKDFAIENIGDYILSEPVVKGGIKDVNWTNVTEKQSWIVFNPSKTNPAMNLPAHSGNKMFAAFYNYYSENEEIEANDDYLVRPVSKGGGEFIFYCRAYSASYPEVFEVVYSSTTADLKEFKALKTYRASVASWSPVVVEIPENAKYIGIHCISKDAFVFLVDDLAYYAEDPANPTGYELYLDGNKVKDAKADELTYTMKGLSVGEHKVGVKAIYASGASKLVEKTVNISAEAAPIKLNVEVEEGMAVLTWDIPEGFAPKSYKVFLGEELKAENLTEKTYTFNDLENGKYTAAVVAVYETGESEKATVEFEIEGADVEDFGMAVRSSVYPNPNDGMFYLQAADKGMVEVYTMNGQMVKRMMIPAEGVYTIDLQNRAKGMYLVRFMSANSASYFKVMVR